MTTMAKYSIIHSPFALAVLLAGIDFTRGVPVSFSPSAFVTCTQPRGHLFGGAERACAPSTRTVATTRNNRRRPNDNRMCEFMINPSKQPLAMTHPTSSALFAYAPSDQGDVIGGEPPRKPPLVVRAYMRGVGRIQRAGGTPAVVLASIVLLALCVYLGRMAWAKAYVYLEWFFTEMYRQTTTPPWEYEKKYGHIPLGANPATYGKTKGRGWYRGNF